jgi:adenosylhomocysteine nucleosidase
MTMLINYDSGTLIVTALDMELPTLSTGPIVFTGVGKIRAATALARYLAENEQIRRVINYGTAGGIRGVTKGKLYPVNRFIESDFRSCSVNLPNKVMIEVPTWLDNTEHLCCSTQDHFVTDPTELDDVLYGNQVNLVDMESYALAYVCQQFSVDFHCYKYVSDDANETAPGEWIENVSSGEDQFIDLLLSHYRYSHRHSPR